MTYEQFCRQLLLCSAVPQSILTLAMRQAAVCQDGQRNDVFFALMEQQKLWINYMNDVKKDTRFMMQKLAEISSITSSLHHGE